jgi:hypothetical protein
MSSFIQITENPKTGKMEPAAWLDDFYGKHRYAIRFKDGGTYHADDDHYEVKPMNEYDRDDVEAVRDFFNESFSK